MSLFDKLFNKKEEMHADTDICAVAAARMIPSNQIKDPVFAENMMGQTIGFKLYNGNVYAPANGTLEVMFPTGHAFAIRMEDGTGLLVHIGIDTVRLKGKGFKVYAKQGDKVQAGQRIVHMDIDFVKENNLDPTTMLIVTELPEGKESPISFIPYGSVDKGQKINQ